MEYTFQQTPLDGLKARFQGVIFCISLFIFMIRDLLDLGDILIKINILIMFIRTMTPWERVSKNWLPIIFINTSGKSTSFRYQHHYDKNVFMKCL